jgi:CRP-like cAMP-binding protein
MDCKRFPTKSPRNGGLTRTHQHGTNFLLSLLPEAERQRLLSKYGTVAMAIETVLYKAGSPIDAVYFPLSGMVSLVIDSAEGETIEIGVVGNEGAVGFGVALGAAVSHNTALIQMAGEFVRIRRDDFLAEFANSAALGALVGRFSLALTAQISQSVLCNHAHPMEERICRWLLMAHDRAGGDEIRLTQRFLADMLGVRRPTVTVAAGMLQKAGYIGYSRGTVRVLDRQGLEDTACECYYVVNQRLCDLLLA